MRSSIWCLLVHVHLSRPSAFTILEQLILQVIIMPEDNYGNLLDKWKLIKEDICLTVSLLIHGFYQEGQIPPSRPPQWQLGLDVDSEVLSENTHSLIQRGLLHFF